MGDLAVALKTDLSRSATITIATATSANPESYDIQLDGTADEVEINAAIQSLSGTGGTIVIGEGAVNQTGTMPGQYIALNVDGVTLKGQGKATVIASVSTTSMILSGAGANVTLADIATSNVEIRTSGSVQAKISNCYGNLTLAHSGTGSALVEKFTGTELVVDGTGTTSLMNCTASLEFGSYNASAKLMIIGCRAPDLYCDPAPATLIPPTATDIQKVNDIPNVYIG